MNPLWNWKERLRRPRPGAAPRATPAAEAGFLRLAAEVEQGLRDIDFDEVTAEDRITFVECAVAWRVRWALRRGNFDLAIRLQRFGAERAAQLYESAHGWRPVLLYGVATTRRGRPPRGLTS